MVPRVTVTKDAAALIASLKQKFGALIFHQSGGCCDGSSPMCLEKGDLMINETDVWLGEIEGCDFYMSKDQFAYWQHTQIEVRVVAGRGSSFSLEIPSGKRFIISSRMFSEEELSDLSPIHFGEYQS
ncbi:DUF779 domain-containing protein [Persicobacter sp. CCB-QB2]|uniref:DUF779 domain-containing protein n=1 Tax=Persicobacter sp. CCB-QB2 TaxID=1561025 RepID=UPI0006A9FFE4|nr:DUF779 domain-containing protein [Persicobacter sp. CCB-QB2]